MSETPDAAVEEPHSPDAEAASADAAPSVADIASDLLAGVGASADPLSKWGLGFILPAGQLRAALTALRDHADLQVDLLLDITGVDYLAYPGWRDARFGVVYVLRSLQSGLRLHLKVLVEEDEAEVPSIHDLFKNANWAEREVWDQYGIRFVGHPNLKRLLNHHEFVGHPLRKDYPVQKRQHLSINDPMLDELVQTLERRGFEVLDDGVAASTAQSEADA